MSRSPSTACVWGGHARFGRKNMQNHFGAHRPAPNSELPLPYSVSWVRECVASPVHTAHEHCARTRPYPENALNQSQCHVLNVCLATVQFSARDSTVVVVNAVVRIWATGSTQCHSVHSGTHVRENVCHAHISDLLSGRSPFYPGPVGCAVSGTTCTTATAHSAAYAI